MRRVRRPRPVIRLSVDMAARLKAWAEANRITVTEALEQVLDDKGMN